MIDFPILALFFAFTLDLLVGDPRWLPHPIRWMGKSIEILEPRFRRLPIPLTLSGGAMATLLVVLTYLMTDGLIQLALFIDPLLYKIFSIILIFFSISINSLYHSAQSVLAGLQKHDLKEAQIRVGWIVGRDTGHLDESGVRLATIETVAENFVDGVAAPLFFAALGGAPMAMAYKMINTMDSMIGYKNERYHQFGKVAARLDDIVNFLPARLAVPVIAFGAQLLGQTGQRSWATAKTEGAHHSSPNAGHPEAAFAGALGVRLNGPGIYGGNRVEKPFIGKKFGPAGVKDIQRACDLLLVSSGLWLIVTIVIRATLLLFNGS